MKALELKTFHIWGSDEGGWYADDDGQQFPISVGYEVLRKRLTDAELAAELWRDNAINSDTGAGFTEQLEAWYRVETWHRFATLPHYDEAV